MSGPDLTKNVIANNQSPDGDTTFVTSISGQRRNFLPGEIIDNVYQLIAHIGSGGMGSVYSCRHMQMGKDYAIKILSGDQLSAEHWTRFIAEAQALGRLKHPGIVGVYNLGVDAGQFPYFVMDLLSGETLESLVAKNKYLSVEQSLDMFIQVAAALGAAHAQGIIHRDIKPSNIMLLNSIYDRPGSVKVVDFGIARLTNKSVPEQSQTKTGMVFGTPLYMSPEQTQGARVDERSDIYSLGCALYECLTGSPPFHGENHFQTFMMHQTETPPRLSERLSGQDFSLSLELALSKMLRKKAVERYQTMEQVQQDLERIRSGKTIMGVSAVAAADHSGALTPEPVSNSLANHADRVAQRAEISYLKIAAIGAASFVILSGATFALYSLLNGPNIPAPLASSSPEISPLDANEIKDISTFGVLKEEQPILESRLKMYRDNRFLSRSAIKQSNPPGFSFPPDFSVGAIKIGHDAPRLAMGFISCPPGSRVVLYLTKYSENWPQFLNKFGPYDLNGLQVRTNNPQALIKEVRKLKGLDELVFFNSLLKAVEDSTKAKDRDNEAGSDESVLKDTDLADIDTLSNIRTLGLCGIHVHGGEIVKMRLFKKLTGLKLKRISDVQKVIDVLPAMDNIKELMLVAQETTDSQIEQLSHMKNLETLQIRRGRLTSASVQIFKKMPALKHLILDRTWSKPVESQLKTEIAGYEYEPVTDRTYWQLIPSDK